MNKKYIVVFGVLAVAMAGALVASAETIGAATTSTWTMPTQTMMERANQPMLTIGQNGAFLARGMTVMSVGGNTFTAQVWGITYTINWSGNLQQFLYRTGAQSTSTPADQVKVGDEVGVSGKIASSTPLVVNAAVVRDYSIVVTRPGPMPTSTRSMHVDIQENGTGTMMGEGGRPENVSGTMPTPGSVQERLNGLMNQLRTLQNMFHGSSSSVN